MIRCIYLVVCLKCLLEISVDVLEKSKDIEISEKLTRDIFQHIN